MNQQMIERAAALLEAFRRKQWMLAIAESCTGGLVAALLTEVPGSSDVVERGFVTYSNEAKTGMLGVPAAMISSYGAVSEPVARAMAEGALEHSRAEVAVSITGVAGPGGGSDEKPVGLVHFGLARRGRDTTVLVRRYGDLGRPAVRRRAVEDALWLLESAATP